MTRAISCASCSAGRASAVCGAVMENTDMQKSLLAEQARSSLLQEDLVERSKRVADLERNIAKLSRKIDGYDTLFSKLSSVKRELLSARQDVDFERGLRLRQEDELRSVVDENVVLRSKNSTLEFFIGAHVKETADASVQTECAVDTEGENGSMGDGAGEAGTRRHFATTELCAHLKRIEQSVVEPMDSRWVSYARATIECDAQLYAVFVMLERLVRAKRLAVRTTPMR